MSALTAKYRGLTLSLEVDEYNQLLRRFSYENYDLYDDSVLGNGILIAPGNMPLENFDYGDRDPRFFYYMTMIDCPLCVKYGWTKKPFCTGCTFSQFGFRSNEGRFGKFVGCRNVINLILAKEGFKVYKGALEYGHSYISFNYFAKEEAFKQLSAIKNWLIQKFGEKL